MNREELKKHITNFRLNLPHGMKFAVIAQSAAVLESSKDLHCDYLYVAMERTGHFWALQTYGDVETRIEGTWTGNSWLKVYPCYDEEHLVMVDGIPCQYVGETNPFMDDPMLERPIPNITDYMKHPSKQSRAIHEMANILREGMTERDGLIDISPEALQAAMDVGIDKPSIPVVVTGAEPMITRNTLETREPFLHKGIIVSPPPLVLTDKNVDFADVCGDYLGLGGLVDDMMESRSASKALLRSPTSLKDTPHGEFQAWRRLPFNTAEYRGRLVRCSEDQLKLTDDLEQNRRRYNSASLKVKVTYKRRLAAWARALDRESMTAQCTVLLDINSGWMTRRTQAVVKDDSGNLHVGFTGSHLLQPPGGHIEPEDHTVDSIATAGRFGALVRKQLLGKDFHKGYRIRGLDEETGPIKQTEMGADIDGDMVDGEFYLDPVGKAALERQKKEEDK
jgi:hypothetical protein